MEESNKTGKGRRTFSASFKQEKVKQIEAKKVSVLQLSRAYDVSAINGLRNTVHCPKENVWW
ncbi:MAG TPA: hypothetical protein VFM79_06370 [Pelobium sp.]|nr:hypothetical protein [Pelobium sp.]